MFRDSYLDNAVGDARYLLDFDPFASANDMKAPVYVCVCLLLQSPVNPFDDEKIRPRNFCLSVWLTG